jgi:hypothetical protein
MLFCMLIISISYFHAIKHLCISNNNDNDNDGASPTSNSYTTRATSSTKVSLINDDNDGYNDTSGVGHHHNHHIDVDDVATKKWCCGRLAIPSIGLVLFHISTLSYSVIVKTSSSLLECRQSPLTRDRHLIMFHDGTSPISAF